MQETLTVLGLNTKFHLIDRFLKLQKGWYCLSTSNNRNSLYCNINENYSDSLGYPSPKMLTNFISKEKENVSF